MSTYSCPNLHTIAEIDGFAVTDEQLLNHEFDPKYYYRGSLINKLKSIYQDKIRITKFRELNKFQIEHFQEKKDYEIRIKNQLTANIELRNTIRELEEEINVLKNKHT
jgi:hypothetical protein